MGFGRGFTFILGSVCGVYVAQHYKVPRIADWVHSGCVKARELEQAYRSPDNFDTNEGHRVRDCRFRTKHHERNYHRPENFYGNEEQYTKKVLRQDRARPMDLEGTYYRPETLDPNEVHEKQNPNNTIHPSWIRPKDLKKPYNNDGPENFNPNEAGQE
ncbi:hypothetical protein BC332_03158 [Capsicum chinense]|nr:hypothetical protein BC332_03158 [Capsicum chinense]